MKLDKITLDGIRSAQRAYIDREQSGEHYRDDGKPDTVTELYEESMDAGHYFCYGNIKKYLKRLGKKGETPEERESIMKKDLYKIATYCLLMLKHEFGEEYRIERTVDVEIDGCSIDREE